MLGVMGVRFFAKYLTIAAPFCIFIKAGRGAGRLDIWCQGDGVRKI